ncbi:GGDEF domain-containing protein [Conexibacter woesei]|uniref:GGDEF domain-containing protein n=1 Tax=Conexibacter woesei TaxID=191495 RepID=UPI000406E403|nr:GGDEF domain-containing protein [Conexibacter woesei]
MRQSRRVAAAPPEVRFLALLTLGAAGACAVAAAAPVAPGRPVALLVAAAVASVVLAALLILSGPRITPLALAAVVGVMIVATSCLVASATTSAGAMLAGYAYVWLTVYSALFLPPRATQVHALMITIGFGLGLLIDDFSATFTAWLLVSGTVWVSGLTLSGLSARVRRQAETDDLTGLLNRRAFTAAADREHELAARTGADLTVVLIDLDGFKAVNDREGHAAGDQLLAALAHDWQAALRPADILARRGGDEFALLLPATPADGADHVVERLHAAHPFAWSSGVAAWPIGTPLDVALAEADAKLYINKRGRSNGEPVPA